LGVGRRLDQQCRKHGTHRGSSGERLEGDLEALAA
jgi:hypothetical protein